MLSLHTVSQWLAQWQSRLRQQSIWKISVELAGLLIGLTGGLALLLIPLLAGYFIYLAVVLGESLYLLSSTALLTVILLFAIWEDRQLKRTQKLAYSFGIPLSYGYLLALSLVTAVAIISGLLVPQRDNGAV